MNRGPGTQPISSSDFEKAWHSSRNICFTCCCWSRLKWLTL